MQEQAKEWARHVRNHYAKCLVTDTALIVRRLSRSEPSTIIVSIGRHSLGEFTANGGRTFILPLTRELKTFISNPADLHVRVDGQAVRPRLYHVTIREKRDRLPREHLSGMRGAGWSFDRKGHWVPPTPYTDEPFDVIHEEAPGRAVGIRGTRRSLNATAEYGSVEVYIDHVKVTDALLGPDSTGSETFSFRLDKALATQVYHKHVLSFRYRGGWTPIDRDVIRRALGPDMDTISRPSVLKPLEAGRILDRRGRFVESKANDSAWIERTFELYDHARTEFRNHWDYDLFPVGGTLLALPVNPA